MTENLTPPVSVLKLANGRYRWWAASSVNVRDVDGEIFSEQAMLADVARTKASADDSRLLVYHIDGEGVQLGGAPDWREVVGGHLLESGLFDDTPVGRGFARFFAAHPEGTDGTGNAMSIGFNGFPDASGVYAYGVIKERSILPRSQAAVPITMLSVKEAALEPRQLEFLEKAKTMMDDPEVVNAVNLMLAAASQSKALDQAGLQRKATADAVTPAGQLQFTAPGTYSASTAGVLTATTAQGALGFAAGNVVKMDDPTKKPDEPPPTDKPVTEQKADTLPPDPAVDPAVADAPAEDVTAISDTDLLGIAQYIDARVGEMVAKLQTDIAAALSAQLEAAIPKMIKATQTIAADTAQNEVVKAYNEQPRSTFDRLNALSIGNRKNAANTSTVVPTSHPLFAPDASPDNPQGLPQADDEVSGMMEYLGFGKKPSQNGANR